MKKIIATISAVLFAVFSIAAQEPMEEHDRLNIGVERPIGIKYDNAAQTLRNNLVQAFVLNGVAAVDSRFTTVTNVVELSKDVTSSAPVMYITELEMSIFVIDLYTGTIFGQTSFTIKGIGDNEGASYMDAIRNVKARNPKLRTLITSAKDKIFAYFDAESDQIFNRIDALIASGDYKAAMIEANAIPRSCAALYNKVSLRIAAIPASATAGLTIDRSLMDGYYFSGSRDARIAQILN